LSKKYICSIIEIQKYKTGNFLKTQTNCIDMTDVEVKWLNFAKKYILLSEGEKSVWLKKLSNDQKAYLDKLIQQIQLEKNSANLATSNSSVISANNLPISNQVINKSLVATDSKQTNSFQNLKSSAQNQIQIQANPTSSNTSRTLNMSMIMPTKTLDFGMSKAVAPSSINTVQVAGHNLSKDEYLKKKKTVENKNSLMQAALVLLVLALPLGSVVFALNNSTGVAKAANGARSMTQVLAENSAINMSQLDDNYNAWIAGYNDLTPENKDKNTDADSDGLTNIEEMALKTIPTNDRTCNSARLDGENILAGIDPVTCKPVNFSDPNVAAKYDGVVPRTTINHRLSVIALNRFHKDNPIISAEDRAAKLDIDYTKNATLELLTTNPDLGNLDQIQISWAQLTGTKDMVKKMEDSVVMYPDLAVIGQPGVNYISGRHIDKNNPNSSVDLFSKLDQLSPGDGFKLSLETKDGMTHKYYYKVKNQNLVLASDPKQFIQSKAKDSELILATPWPNYSPEHRMVIKSVLDRVE